MKLLEVLASVLQSAGIGTVGQDIFWFHMPENHVGVLLLPPLEGIERDENVPGYKKAYFRAVIRNTDYQSALTVANQVASALDFHRVTVSGVKFKRVRPTTDPIPFPVPESDVIEVSVNLWAAYADQ